MQISNFGIPFLSRLAVCFSNNLLVNGVTYIVLQKQKYAVYKIDRNARVQNLSSISVLSTILHSINRSLFLEKTL